MLRLFMLLVLVLYGVFAFHMWRKVKAVYPLLAGLYGVLSVLAILAILTSMFYGAPF